MDKQQCMKDKKTLASELRDKCVLISGATGLIGARVVAYLVALNETENANIRIVALYRSKDKVKTEFKHLIGISQIDFVEYKIGDKIQYIQDVDYIIHCAEVSGGLKMHLKDPVKVFDIGITGTRDLLEFAVEHHCKGFLYVSTYEVYGSIYQDNLIKEDSLCELDTFTLRNIYAEIKRLCESLCCAYSCQYGVETYAVRLTSTFGTGVKYSDPRFFAEFARCIVNSEDIVLKSSGKTVRSYLDADDAATAFLYVLTKGKNCNAYNLTNMNNAISIKDMAMRMIEVSGKNIKLKIEEVEDVTKLGFRKEGTTLMDATKLEELGWKPVYSLDETLLKVLNSIGGGQRENLNNTGFSFPRAA